MDRFSEIVGQEIILSHLQNALRTGGVSHAYILNGAKGSGRHMLARSFSAALLCENPQRIRKPPADPAETVPPTAELQGNPADLSRQTANLQESPADPFRQSAALQEGPADPARQAPALREGNQPPGLSPQDAPDAGRWYLEPCGECLSCLQAASGSNPDIITVEHEKENSIGVGEIRRMRADVQIRPYRASHKVYILPDAEKMTPAAQNALLKTLEEPPSYAVLLLLADGTAGFLPTILSRCVTLPLRPVAESAVEQVLTGRFGADPQRARLCARFSGGSIGRAVLLLQNENFASLRDRTTALLRELTKKDAAELAAFARDAAAEDQTQDLIDFILIWIRDLLVCRSTFRTENLIFTDEVQYIIEAARSVSWRGLQAASEAVFRARRRLASNVNAELTLQMMLLELRGAFRQ